MMRARGRRSEVEAHDGACFEVELREVWGRLANGSNGCVRVWQGASALGGRLVYGHGVGCEAARQRLLCSLLSIGYMDGVLRRSHCTAPCRHVPCAGSRWPLRPLALGSGVKPSPPPPCCPLLSSLIHRLVNSIHVARDTRCIRLSQSRPNCLM
jgi:hypothetical protein